MEQIYHEVGDTSIRGRLDQFWNGWQELSNFPADIPPRTALAERGKTLVDAIQKNFKSLKGLQDMAEQDIRLTTNRVNNLTGQIAGLNKEIQRIQAQGDNPNDLMDRRDLLTDQLSSLIDITVDRRDPDEFMIHTAGMILVQGGVNREFTLRPTLGEEGYSQIYWKDTTQEVHFRDGRLAALIELRDVTIQDEIRSLDNFTMNFMDLVNEVHRQAYDLTGGTGNDFFVERPYVTNVNGNYDRSGDGVFDSSYIFRINGTNALELNAQTGLEGVITLSGPDGNVEVRYFPTDTVADIINRINSSGAEVAARLNREGMLQLKGTPAEGWENPDFVIRHVEDSGYFLEGYAGLLNARGPDGAFDWGGPDAVTALRGGSNDYAAAPIAHPSGWIEINPLILRDVTNIAAGFGENGRSANPGNGEAAIAISALRHNRVMVGKNMTFDEYFADTVGRVGAMGERSGSLRETNNITMKELKEQRQSVAGVNINEELADMLRYQHGFNAASRFITTINAMLDTIINRMGV
jgi:flagellar hook-associated protein 1 FlgK